MKIKVCGITREEDIAELLLAGVDFIGFNFIKSSPRYIDINWALNIISKFIKSGNQKELDRIQKIVQEINL